MKRWARCSLLAMLVLGPAAVAQAKPRKKERPKVEEKMEAPREEPPPGDTRPPVITHLRVARATAGEPLIIRARIEDDSEVFAPSVSVRPAGRTDFDSIPMRRVSEGFEAVVPAEQVTGDLEYFIEAFDEQGNGPAREGTPEAPIRVALGAAPKETKVPELVQRPPPPPPPPEGSSVLTQWWFWTIVGVAVTGGVLGGALVLQGGGRVDAVDIEVRGPDPAGGL